MKLCTLIITKNSSSKLKRLLNDLNSHKQLKNFPIFIIDDSTSKEIIEENIKQAYDVYDLKCTYINAQIWNDLREKYVIPKIGNNRRLNNFVSSLNLGSSNWNTPNSRNIGMIVLNLYRSDFEFFLSLDDDMSIPHEFILEENNLYTLAGLKTLGSPDFGRVNWIQLYIRFLNRKYGEMKDSSTAYFNIIANSLDLSQIQNLIHKYTDLEIYSNNIHNDIKIPLIPSRNVISGEAYISALNNVTMNMFPSSYNEDWMWFNLVKNTSAANECVVLNKYLIHNASVKHIMDKKLLELEEEGRAFYQLFVEPNFNNSISKKSVSLYLEKRGEEISQEILLIKQLSTFVSPIEKNQLKKISNNLNHIKSYIISQKPDKYIDLFNDFLDRNILWNNLQKNYLYPTDDSVRSMLLEYQKIMKV